MQLGLGSYSWNGSNWHPRLAAIAYPHRTASMSPSSCAPASQSRDNGLEWPLDFASTIETQGYSKLYESSLYLVSVFAPLHFFVPDHLQLYYSEFYYTFMLRLFYPCCRLCDKILWVPETWIFIETSHENSKQDAFLCLSRERVNPTWLSRIQQL